MKLLIIILLLLLTRISFAENVKFRFEAPITNTDGTPLVDLTGFKIHQGTTTGTYETIVDIYGVLCTVITNLTIGTTYYFVVTAYNESREESDYSNEASKLINMDLVGSCVALLANRNLQLRNIPTRSQVNRVRTIRQGGPND